MLSKITLTHCAVLLLFSGAAYGVNVEGIKLAPGERLVAIDGVPVDAATAAKVETRTSATTHTVKKVDTSADKVATAESTEATATNIVGNLVRSNKSFSHSDGATALDKANTERAKQGFGALVPDPALQRLALRKATIAAKRSFKNHIGGSLGGAKCEGVGFTNGRFLTCCLDERGTYGGAAMVKGRDGWYCCLLVR